MELWWAFVLLGIVCGIYSSVFGVGAGTLLIPGLVLVFSLPQKSAQGVCLAVMVPMVLVGAIRYKLNPDIDVDMTVVLFLAIGGVVGAFIGAGIAGVVPAMTLRKLFAVLLILLAVRMLLTSGPKPKPESAPHATPLVQQTDNAPGGA